MSELPLLGGELHPSSSPDASGLRRRSPREARALPTDSQSDSPRLDPPGFGAGVDQPAATTRRKRTRKPASARRRAGADDPGKKGGEPPKTGDEAKAGATKPSAPPAAEGKGDPPPDAAKGETSRSARSSRGRGGARSGRRRKVDAAGDKPASAPVTPPKEDAAVGEEEGADRRRSRRAPRRRGRVSADKRAARRTEEDASPPAAPPTDTPPGEAGEAGESTPRRRKRGTRGGRRRTRKSGIAVEIEVIPGEDDELPELADLPEDAVLVNDNADGPAGKGERSSSRTRRRKKAQGAEAAPAGRGAKTAKGPSRASGTGRTTGASEGKSSGRKAGLRTGARTKKAGAEPAAVEVEPKHRLILVNAVDPEETRVAVVEDGKVVDLQMTVKKHSSYVSDIYRGRVVNLEPAIGAAFVDFGQGRNGFLHASDVLTCYGEKDWSLEKLLSTTVEADEFDPSSKDAEEIEVDEADVAKTKKRGATGVRGRSRMKRPRLPIEQLVKKGQMVAVQITKDAIGDKGPTLTTYISIPSRYLVLMPSLERTGVSRKIEDEKERRRLKRILSSLPIPEGMGVIVRTAGVGKTKEEIERDLDYLMLTWKEFSHRLVSGRNPAALYQESDVAIRTMRDLFTANTEAVIVDDEEVHERVVEFTNKLMPEHQDRIRLHKGPRPLFHSHGVEQDFEKIFSRRVELPSGGSIVIDQTEALVAIDVNSGRTREAGAEFEDIALKTNLEAVPEIARQIRLRDLGGIIVLDFIDMMRAGSRSAVERAVRDVLQRDRARSKIGRISQFGLLELTRQRLGPGLSKLVYDTCRHCRGSGRQRNASSRAQAILRRLGAALILKGFTTVEVRAHPETIEHIEKYMAAELEALGEQSGRKLVLVAAPDQLEDSVLHYLRADGREVRPGGRRKR